jgi:lysophospholipid acyltransferase (LPLAT)-like uncharacterized protein
MIKDKLFFSIIPPIGSLIIKFIGKTTRWELINYERIEENKRSDKPVIFAFWHGRLLMIPYICFGKNPTVLISQHRDGELISRIAKHFDVNAVRGSTTRGGKEGFKKIVRTLQSGSDVVIAPDGPKGPPYIVQPGIIRLASYTGCQILPIAYSISIYKKLKSWDEFMLPAPFGKGAFIAGDLIKVPPKASDDVYEQKRITLEQSLNEITETVDKKVSAISKTRNFKYQSALKIPSGAEKIEIEPKHDNNSNEV